MNKAYSEYKINGWLVIASELNNDWDLFPDGMTIEQHEDFNNNECIIFKRLSEAKSFIKTDKANELKEKYTK